MAVLRIAVIAGDGIGPEVTAQAIRACDRAIAAASEDRLDWRYFPWNSDYYFEHGRMMPSDGLDRLRDHDAILLGAIGHPSIRDHITLNGLLLPIRRGFDQFVNLRPAILYDGVVSPLRDRAAGTIDLVVLRENTEGEYSDVGGRLYARTDHEVAIQTNVFTRRGTERIMKEAFAVAGRRRRQVTSITKSNAQGHSMVFWDEVFAEVAQAHPDIQSRSLLVDAAAMELVRRPETFDVIVASNLFGDILTDLAAAVVGSIGLAASGNINPARTAPSMFEPVHGSAPDIAGKGVANPLAAILAAAMMLEHLQRREAAHRIDQAVRAVLQKRQVLTPDLGGKATTKEVGEAVLAELDG